MFKISECFAERPVDSTGILCFKVIYKVENFELENLLLSVFFHMVKQFSKFSFINFEDLLICSFDFMLEHFFKNFDFPYFS